MMRIREHAQSSQTLTCSSNGTRSWCGGHAHANSRSQPGRTSHGASSSSSAATRGACCCSLPISTTARNQHWLSPFTASANTRLLDVRIPPERRPTERDHRQVIHSIRLLFLRHTTMHSRKTSVIRTPPCAGRSTTRTTHTCACTRANCAVFIDPASIFPPSDDTCVTVAPERRHARAPRSTRCTQTKRQHSQNAVDSVSPSRFQTSSTYLKAVVLRGTAAACCACKSLVPRAYARIHTQICTHPHARTDSHTSTRIHARHTGSQPCLRPPRSSR